MHRAANALGRNHPPRPGAFACLKPQVALLPQTHSETLTPYHASRGNRCSHGLVSWCILSWRGAVVPDKRLTLC
jgi:hypothetical protein